MELESRGGSIGRKGGGVFQGQYQDVLRSVGAWLDARGCTLINLGESGDQLVIEVRTGQPGGDVGLEVLRLDRTALDRLTHAGRNDRNRFAATG